MHVTGNEVTAGAAALAFLAAMLTLRQRAAADRHDAWWSRAQWAVDLSLTGRPESRRIGTDAMYVLADDLTATDADLQVLASALHRALLDPSAGADAGPTDTGPADTGPADTGPADTGPAGTGPADAAPADTAPAGTTAGDASRAGPPPVLATEPPVLAGEDAHAVLSARASAARALVRIHTRLAEPVPDSLRRLAGREGSWASPDG